MSKCGNSDRSRSSEAVRRFGASKILSRGKKGGEQLIKTLFSTGVRESGLVALRLDEVDIERCQIRINHGKGDKDRQVPFPISFRELLALHMHRMHEKQATYLFESVRKRKYTDRGVRKMLERYAKAAGITRSVSPDGGTFCSPGSKKRGLMTR